MPRFFVPQENIRDGRLTIGSGDAAHISKVLRMSVGDVITVCDGRGYDYTAQIDTVNAKEIICGIIEKRESKTEPNISVTLYQGIPKAAKMDYIIQKTTELGVSEIVPVAMGRCVAKIGDEKTARKKLERWNRIAEEAAKQSQRGIVPKVCAPMSFEEAAENMKKADLCFAPYECEEQNRPRDLFLHAKGAKTAAFMIGPEGGYELDEAEKLRELSIPTITLGKRILRTETAGEAVLAMLMYEIGDVNI